MNRSALQQALDRIVARHEALRTCFVVAQEGVRQHIAASDSGLALKWHDLSALAPAEQAAQLKAISVAEASQAFDLAQGPLIRGQLLRLSEAEHILLLTQHHIISDGWSMGVFVQELSTLYQAFSEAKVDPLPALPIQYADYALWQRNWLQGEVLQQQLSYWREHLSGAPALLELPT
ncbi:condensation domain-containing protein, partial [Neisseriaceae bacterium TC5R-5]|nr:condensation domain-containing protein [Neisseriaceae bacterium TC5R-5]